MRGSRVPWLTRGSRTVDRPRSGEADGRADDGRGGDGRGNNVGAPGEPSVDWGRSGEGDRDRVVSQE